MKKILGCLLALLLVIGMMSVSFAEETYTVVFIPGEVANESQGFSAKMFEKHGAEFGMEVIIMDGQGDAQIQAQCVTNCIAQGVDALFVNPNDINGIVPSLMEAKAAGIVVGMFSSDLAADFADYRDFFVGVDDNSAGVSGAEAFIKQFPDGAKIVEIGGQAGHDAQIKRHDGFIEGLEGSNIELMDSQACDTWSTAEAMAIAEDFIVKYGSDIQGIFCHWDNGATGVIEALKAAGMEDVYLVAVDGCRAGFDQVRAGDQAITVMQNFEAQAIKTLELTKTLLEGGTVEKINLVPLDLVSIDNIDTFTAPEW